MTYINQYDPNNQFSTEEHCDINELLNHTTDAHCSIARASVAPGVCTQLHAVKNTIERYIILEGHGKVFVNNTASKEVGHLDVVTIPAGVAQKIQNIGDAELIFLCICTPRFEQKNYINLELERIVSEKYTTPYQAVSCAMHSELELAIMHGDTLCVHFVKSNNLDNGEESLCDEQIIEIKPVDVITRSCVEKDDVKGEFLVGSNESGQQIEIRLDKISQFTIK